MSLLLVRDVNKSDPQLRNNMDDLMGLYQTTWLYRSCKMAEQRMVKIVRGIRLRECYHYFVSSGSTFPSM